MAASTAAHRATSTGLVLLRLLCGVAFSSAASSGSTEATNERHSAAREASAATSSALCSFPMACQPRSRLARAATCLSEGRLSAFSQPEGRSSSDASALSPAVEAWAVAVLRARFVGGMLDFTEKRHDCERRVGKVWWPTSRRERRVLCPQA